MILLLVENGKIHVPAGDKTQIRGGSDYRPAFTNPRIPCKEVRENPTGSSTDIQSATEFPHEARDQLMNELAYALINPCVILRCDHDLGI